MQIKESDALYAEINLLAKVCVDGYVFVTLYEGFQNNYGTGMTGSLTQFFENIDGKSVPKKC